MTVQNIAPKTIEDIKADYESGAYKMKEKYPERPSFYNELQKGGQVVIDENKSVKWNREEALRLSTEWAEKKAAWNNKSCELDSKLRNDVVDSLVAVDGLTEAVAYRIESFVWQEKHSSMCDYFYYLPEVRDLVKESINAVLKQV